jgi:hypothetical protein
LGGGHCDAAICAPVTGNGGEIWSSKRCARVASISSSALMRTSAAVARSTTSSLVNASGPRVLSRRANSCTLIICNLTLRSPMIHRNLRIGRRGASAHRAVKLMGATIRAGPTALREVHVHVLDDLDGLSPRAQAFLRRSGDRQAIDTCRLPTDYLRVLDRLGRRVTPPVELVVRREGFVQRFGGLRYRVRSRVRLDGEPYETVRRWDFVLEDWIRHEPNGWSFGWVGQRVSSPVRYLVRSDGRFGVTLGGPFLEVSPSIYHMIESHALTDEMAEWEPVTGSALEPWAASCVNGRLLDRAGDLRLLPEASGPCERWLHSDTMTVRQIHRWTEERPRPTSVQVWTRDGTA